MRVGRAIQTGRGQASFQIYGSTNIFHAKLPSVRNLATDQTPVLKMANQCNYAHPNYSYDGSPAPSFYGYSGMGYGGNGINSQTTTTFWFAPKNLYVVDDAVPNQYVTYVNYTDSTTYTPYPAGHANNLQSYFTAVPIPDVSKVPSGQLWGPGSDREVNIWRPSTNEAWEMWRLYGSSGSYVFGTGAYTNTANNFAGVWPYQWGPSASGTGISSRVLTIQDIVDALRGQPIKHALSMSLEVTLDAFVAPATHNDSHTNSFQYQSDGTTPNPAYGDVDGVPEGTWLAFPASFDPVSAMPGAGPLQLAIATAMRDYGVIITDSSGATVLHVQWAGVLGSPYSYAKVNPFADSSGPAHGYYDSINSFIPDSWTDSSLPSLSETLGATPNNVLSKIPWQQLQVLEPPSS